jgi:hypothetical protein
MALLIQETPTTIYPFPENKRNSRSLDLPSSSTSRRHHTRSNSDSAPTKDISIDIGSIPIQNTESSLSAVLPTTESPTSPTSSNNSLLFNFGLGAKKSPSRNQSFCSSIIQKVSRNLYIPFQLLFNVSFYRSLQPKSTIAIDQEEALIFRHFRVLQERANLPQAVPIHSKVWFRDHPVIPLQKVDIP